MKCTILLLSILIFEVHSEIQHGIRQVRQIKNEKEDFDLEKDLGGYDKGDEKGPKYKHENGKTKPEVNFREYDDSGERGRTGRKGKYHILIINYMFFISFFLILFFIFKTKFRMQKSRRLQR